VERPSLVIHTGKTSYCIQLDHADNWLGVSKRDGSASYSGPGGNASGGSVKNLCSERRAIHQTLADSGVSSSVPISSRSGGSLLARQKKWGMSSLALTYLPIQTNSCEDNPSAAYSGKGGNAPGGGVEGDHALINAWSGQSCFTSFPGLG
jgi:hypothetical protein